MKTAFADIMLGLFTVALVAAGAAGVRDVLADPRSPARIEAGTPHLLTPPPILSLALAPQMTILLVGADDRQDRGRADTMIVAKINTRTRRAALMSLQRDTKAPIPGHGETKINHAYRFGGIPLLKQTLEPLLGEHFDRYAKLDFKTFKKAIDILGGVTIAVPDVEKRGRGMNYDDNADGLHIHLRPGTQRLNGEQAIGYVRYRRDSDIFRAERQREFLKAVAEQHIRARKLPALLRVVKLVRDEIDTDLSTREALRLATAMRGIPTANIMTAMMPTVGGLSHGVFYSRIDEPAAAQLRAKMKTFLEGSGTVATAAQSARPLKECAIVVLNGSGRKGSAEAAAARIRRARASVAGMGNADRFDYDHTEIRYHPGAEAAARELQRILGVRQAELRLDEKFEAAGAASIIVTLGKDFGEGK